MDLKNGSTRLQALPIFHDDDDEQEAPAKNTAICTVGTLQRV